MGWNNPVDNPWTERWTAGKNVRGQSYCGCADLLGPPSCTAYPPDRTQPDLLGRQLSPGSTGPTTTTGFISNRNPKQPSRCGRSSERSTSVPLDRTGEPGWRGGTRQARIETLVAGGIR